ncbi:nucleotidyltransferase family protein [Wenyingzhuangia sp. IMCC45574]
MSNKTALLVLAAGASKRMGSPKQLLPIKDQILLTVVVQQALQVCENDTYVVLGANFNTVSEHLKDFSSKILFNMNWDQGIGSSIAFGISEIHSLQKYDQVVLLLADQPTVVAQDIQDLIKYHIQHINKITVTRCKNYIGVPAVFDASFFEEMMQLSDDYGAKTIVKKHIDQVSLFKIDREIWDVDTQEDYQKILKNMDS